MDEASDQSLNMDTNFLKMPYSLSSASLAFIFVSAELFILAMRLRVLIPPEHRPSVSNALKAFFHGQIINNLTISGLGDAYKFKAFSNFKESKNLSLIERSGIILMDKGMEITTLLFLFIFGCHEFNQMTMLGQSTWLKYGSTSIIIAGTALSLVYFYCRKKISSKIITPKNIFNGYSLSLIAWSLELGAILILCSRYNINISQGLLILATLSIGSILPSTPAKIGVYEGSMLVGLTQSNIDIGSAIKIATSLHAILISNILIAALFIFVLQKIQISKKEVSI